MLKSYLLFIHRLMIFALTTNAITIIVFIMYLYMYLLKSLYLLKFIVASKFIQLECISSICISTVFIGNVFIQFYFCFIYIYSYLLGWIYFSFLNTCAIKFIEGKFYFEGRACYIGKIMPTCIE